ncbi:MAG: SufD family Fe-S cluster assembly protein [Candidatus Omnitrophica bacterium]|nr:SufD family Fe-S cluster assembly protein [Candidatus Omnitrophota bacterium]
MTKPLVQINEEYEQLYGFKMPERYVFKARQGLTPELVKEISWMKGEPEWMTKYRLRALEHFTKKPLPAWANLELLEKIQFDAIYYYLKPTEKKSTSWEDVPEEIKKTFDRLGIPEAERKFLAGVSAQYESESVYHSMHESLQKLGVIFLDTDSALKEQPELLRKFFGTVIPPADNKFAALNSAVWSGGSFIYVPKGVTVDMPLQAYFRINAERMGQFERTLIIADEGSSVHYIEGCLPPGERVSTGRHWVNIESLRPGDVVLNSDGIEARVSAVRARPFTGELITIQPISAGNAFQVTPEHPVLAVPRQVATARRRLRGNWLPEVDTKRLLAAEPQFIEAGQLKPGDFLVFPISRVVRDDPRYTVPLLRLLGYYLAEGSTYVHRTLQMPIVSFSFGASEREYIEEVKRLIREVTGKASYELVHKKNNGVTVIVYSKPLMDLCLESCGKGACTKEVSKIVMDLPPEKQAQLLETYFLGDGSRYQRAHAMLRAATASQTLAWQLQELLARQGHYATISVRKGGADTILGRRITRKDQYILYYSPDKQQSEIRRADQTFLVPIKSMRRVPYDGPVFNIELDRAPNAYLARGFAVHNCTAPVYASDSLHSAVVELVAQPHARLRYTTIQNWSKNVYNLVTKRGIAYEDASIEWLDGNLGSKLTMKFPGVYMMGRGARGEVLSVAFAGPQQHQDAGAKMIHAAPDTHSVITSKSISKGGGRTSYRGLVKVHRGAVNSKSTVRCDALLLDEASRSDTYPTMEIDEQRVQIGHEASVSKIGEEQLFYLMSRGLSEQESMTMVVNGFIEPFVKELPLEYAVELNRLVQLEMEGAVG